MSFASGLTPSSAITVSDDVHIDEEVSPPRRQHRHKEITADTIGTIFAATKTYYLRYIEQSVVKLLSLLPHFYEGFRKSATRTRSTNPRTQGFADKQRAVVGPPLHRPPLSDMPNALDIHCERRFRSRQTTLTPQTKTRGSDQYTPDVYDFIVHRLPSSSYERSSPSLRKMASPETTTYSRVREACAVSL